MKVLVVGSGGREHALCWKLKQSPLVSELLCAPGNAGTAALGRNVALAATDVSALVQLARDEAVGLVVIGPEDPLSLGLADKLREHGIAVFGPGSAGARLESSKLFAKELLERHRIPTAAYKRFDRAGAAKSYLESCLAWPQVIKADGLAAGKGVFICREAREACGVIDQIMEERVLGGAGAQVVIEEFLVGQELSVLAITDGKALLTLEPVVDHKQVGDGDTGPNTGGMGVVSPVGWVTRRMLRQVEQRVLLPTLHALRTEEIEFQGVLFAGLMITDGGPRVLEFNCRFGDPETQAILRRFKGDLFPYLLATAQGKLEELEAPEWDARACVGVVVAAEGYPGEYRKGDPISGIDLAEQEPEAVVFQAGTKPGGKRTLTNGGRVLCVSALGGDVNEARERAYRACGQVRFQGAFWRRDIGLPRQKPPAEPSGEEVRPIVG